LEINGKKEAVSFSDFTFQYESQSEPTLHNINLKIYEGEKILIIGPSGSGKSTIGHCINGLAPYFYKGEIKGELKIYDEVLNGIFEHSKYVGTALQDSDAQFVGLSVAEDIAFALENDTVETDIMKKQVNEIAKFVKIEDLLKMKPHDLSGGQKQKVSLAGIMVEDAKIILYDEPLANLDPLSGKYAVELIDELHNRKKLTTIIIEHRLEDVLHKKVDRIIVIDKGKIIIDDTPDNILKSDILKKINIREPLYISALKYSGVDLNKYSEVADMGKMDLSDIKDNILNWIKHNPAKEKENNSETILDLKNIDFSYNEKKKILKNINVDIKKGQMVSIVGSNGAGKSTLSKVITGFEKQDKGEIFYKNKEITGESITERAEKIGFVLQNPNAMISKVTIFDEVALGLKIRGFSHEEIEQRVFKVLEICKLKPFRNWPVKALSYGQKKRVTIASILVLEPEIIIVDEPTAGQDLFHYKEIMEFLKQLNGYGITILFITHDMHLMLEYTDKAYAFNNGEIIKEGKPSEILSDGKILAEANLKKTSLHYLAEAVGINPEDLIKTFVHYEKAGE
jgi:putative ABC transporter, ATP-binding protein